MKDDAKIDLCNTPPDLKHVFEGTWVLFGVFFHVFPTSIEY